ncbi:hypothetical protein BDAP_001343 [Binucleata daphniae]
MNNTKHTSLRRAAILKVEEDNNSHLYLIGRYQCKNIKKKDFTLKQLSTAQEKTLLVNIKSKECHQRLYKVYEHEMTDLNQSATWLTKGNNKPRDEAAFCFLQDRNIFLGVKSLCPHCRLTGKTVDHMATKCNRMLGHDYTRRHNEALRCIHLTLCNK